MKANDDDDYIDDDDDRNRDISEYLTSMQAPHFDPAATSLYILKMGLLPCTPGMHAQYSTEMYSTGETPLLFSTLH